jgi:hypothetical protein
MNSEFGMEQGSCDQALRLEGLKKHENVPG